MARNAEDVRQSPTPSQGPEGSDLNSVAGQIEGLLDDDGHFNPGGEKSRGHPDYDESEDPRAGSPERDERGRFKKAADDSAPADDTGEEELAAEGDVSDEDTEQPDEVEAGDTDEEIASSADDEADDSTEETGEIRTLAEFAEALEVPLDDLKEQLEHTFNAAGEEVTVTLSELEKGYQKDADYRRSTAKLAEERKAQEAAIGQRMQQIEQHNHELAQTLNAAEQIIGAELNDPRLAQLRDDNPAEWTARRDEIGQRLQALRNYRQQAAQQYSQLMAQNLQQVRADEMKALQDAVSDFGESHKTAARETLQSLGMRDDEIGNLLDHRLIVGALELAQLRKENAELREMKQKAQTAVKRVKKEVPKLQKPGKSASGRKPVRRDNLAKLRDRAKKSGSVDDAAKVIEQLI